MAVEDVAADGCAFGLRMKPVVSGGDGCERAGENLADQDFFDDGRGADRPELLLRVEIVLNLLAGEVRLWERRRLAALADRVEAMTPAIESAARGPPVDGEHLVHRLRAGGRELLAVNGGHGGQAGKVVCVHGGRRQGAGSGEKRRRRGESSRAKE